MSSLTLDIRPPIARLRLGRDVIGPAETRDLASVCDAIADDETVRAVVLVSDNGAFCRGWDWAALAGESGKLPGFDGREAINGYNERMLASVRELPVSELLGRLKAAFEESLRILDGLNESDLDKPASSPAWDRMGKVRDLFFASYLHLPGHYQDIRRVAKKKLPHWVDASTEEEVHFQMDRTFHYMPLIYWSDRGADMQATYLFTMEGTGGGQWAVRIGGGKAEAQCGAPESFDMEFRTKPGLWMDLSTNDLNPMWAITTRKIHLDGNTGLAMKLGSLFQVNE